jgi:hypothetical protein
MSAGSNLEIKGTIDSELKQILVLFSSVDGGQMISHWKIFVKKSPFVLDCFDIYP